jgi:4'-phosphopantetheinyl transferase
LRAILARYLDDKADELRFVYGAFGKPAVASKQDRPALEFNLSHSAGFVLLAIATCGGVGIDIEQIDERFDYQAVAVSFFSPEEIEELQWMPPTRARRIFFRLWTLREAIGKARGDGLAVLEDQRHRGAVSESGLTWGCSARELDVGDGYAAALSLFGRREMRPRPWHERLDGWEACYRVALETC